MNNIGIHHISSLVGNIHQAYHFYHHILDLYSFKIKNSHLPLKVDMERSDFVIF